MEIIIIILAVGFICIISYLRAIHHSLQKMIKVMSSEKKN
jgi:hypothetical protein